MAITAGVASPVLASGEQKNVSPFTRRTSDDPALLGIVHRLSRSATPAPSLAAADDPSGGALLDDGGLGWTIVGLGAAIVGTCALGALAVYCVEESRTQ